MQALQAGTASSTPDAATGVTIKVSYIVGEYDILILPAEESDDLHCWLAKNGYNMTAKANDVLADYRPWA